MLRQFRPVIVLSILFAIVLAVAGCGGQPSTAPSPTTTIATGGESGAEALAASKEYETAIRDWVETYLAPAQDELAELQFQDPLKPTASEIERARKSAESLRTALAALQEISAPPEIAAAHSQFCTSFRGEVTAFDRLITGIEGTNEADIELAMRMWEEALALEDGAIRTLNQYVDLSDVIQN
jgi:hypothetical protein